MFGIVGFIMIAIIMNSIISEENTNIQADAEFGTKAKQVMANATSQYPILMDGGFLFLLFGIWSWLIVSAMFIDTHPVFFFIGILAMILLVLLGANLANIYDDFINDDAQLSTTAAQYTKTNFIMNHFLETILVIIFSVSIVLFGKNRQ